MRFFAQLLAVVLLILLAVLGWDLSKRQVTYGDKQVIIYAGMFGPGEPMQLLFSGPPPGIEPPHPFGRDAFGHYAALIAAWPSFADAIRTGYERVFRRPLKVQPADRQATAPADAAEPFDRLPLIEQYRRLKRPYVERLVAALGRKDRKNRMELYRLFAQLHPEHEKRLIPIFERLHPAYKVGLFEEFKRRHPQYEIVERWDGRWVLSANRPRFLTGTDVPDIVAGSLAELRILMKEHLALPLDKPLPDAADPAWRAKGIFYAEASYDDPNVPVAETFYDWALKASTYTVSDEDVTKNNHPYPAGTKIIYLWPNLVHTQVVFYNRAHFRKIGRDPDDVPQTVEQFEQICRQLLRAGIEPIAQDGMTYMDYWWNTLVYRTVGFETYMDTALGSADHRFAGPRADPRYLQVAQRLRRWRDEGFWMKGFSASKWPGAQREFGAGRCTFLFCGTWLPAEIESTRSRDPQVLDLSCFVFPAVRGGAGNPRLITITAQGHVITRQGKNHKGAVLLLKFLSSRAAELLSRRLHYVTAQKGVPLPPELQALAPILAEAKPEDVTSEGIPMLAPKYWKFVMLETFSKFFVIRRDNLSPEQFVQELERRSQDHYRKFGKGT